MASATGIPQDNAAAREDEPLLGGPGDATQRPSEGLQWNFIKGTGMYQYLSLSCRDHANAKAAVLAQAGIVILTALVWAAVFEHEVIFFSYHPLLNSLAVLLFVQAVLVLQPTSAPRDKVTGAYVHGTINTVAVALAVAGLVVIEMNKASHPETRFQSVHGKMALVAYVLVVLQWLVGAGMFFLQGNVIDVDRAKSVYKYHR
jgi:hypothetical protein